MAAKKANALFKLKVPGEPDRIVVFDTQDLSIGRSSENDLAIDNVELSRKHARFTRGEGYCVVEDMGTSNGTLVNGERQERAELSPGDVVRVADIELVYGQTSRNPASLGAPVEYASQLKSFGMPGGGAQDGDATILGMAGAPVEDDDDFEVAPPGDFVYDLDGMAPPKKTPRNLDLEVEGAGADPADDDLGLEAAPPPAPPDPPQREAQGREAPASTEVWEFDEASPAATGTLSLHIELEGLTPDLRATLGNLVGKVIQLPSLRIRLKGGDLG
jgi:predicted component of type VI protein secretion system